MNCRSNSMRFFARPPLMRHSTAKRQIADRMPPIQMSGQLTCDDPVFDHCTLGHLCLALQTEQAIGFPIAFG